MEPRKITGVYCLFLDLYNRVVDQKLLGSIPATIRDRLRIDRRIQCNLFARQELVLRNKRTKMVPYLPQTRVYIFDVLTPIDVTSDPSIACTYKDSDIVLLLKPPHNRTECTFR